MTAIRCYFRECYFNDKTRVNCGYCIIEEIQLIPNSRFQCADYLIKKDIGKVVVGHE